MGPRLPVEVLDNILNWVDNRRDLISFACGSRTFKALVIPRHAEYRVLRVAEGAEWVSTWEHLQRRPDLASNIRILHFVYDPYAPDRGGFRSPRTLVGTDGIPVSYLGHFEIGIPVPEDHYKVICDVVESMDLLHTYVWEDAWGKTFPEDELLLEMVARKPTLRNLMLMYESGAIHRLLDLLENPKSPMWHLKSIQALVIDYNRGGVDDDEFHELVLGEEPFGRWLQSLSSTLTFFCTSPTTFAGYCDDLRLPALRGLSVFEGTQDDLQTNINITSFLQKHPLVEELAWTPSEPITVPGDFLPALRKLVCSPELLLSLDLATPTHSESRKIEQLGINWGVSYKALIINLSELLSLKCLDKSCVRRLHLGRLGIESFKQLLLLPQAFPNVWHLYLHWGFRYLQEKIYASLTQDEWLQLLSRFPNLEVFVGKGPISCTDAGEESEPFVEEAVQRFGRFCPKLRQMAHHVQPRDEDDCIEDVVKKVAIIRDGPEPEAKAMAKYLGVSNERLKTWTRVRWEYEESAPRDVFQAMPWSDDEMK